MFTDRPKEAEFDIGDEVTLDRYNHEDDKEKVAVLGYRYTWGGDLLYVFLRCHTTGGCIVESTHYNPVPAEERHKKIRR